MVLLASVLKPVDDTRMRGKFAETLAGRTQVQVHVAGRGTARPSVSPTVGGISQHGIFKGSRLSLERLAAQWRYGLLLHRLKPDLIIVHAPELLPLTLLWKALGRGGQFVYDIRENYALNVSTQHVYQGLTRRWLAAGLRWVEAQAARRAAAVILAEASYAAELPFLNELPSDRVVVLENKYQPHSDETLRQQPIKLPPSTEPLRLLYSGTISELNGVWEAISLAHQLRAAWPGGARLTIIGFCQQPELLPKLELEAVAHADWLTLIGGVEPVPHAEIVAEIGRSHLGLLSYRPHLSTERCRPTKLFEYLAHGLPMLASPNPLWQEVLDAYGAGLAVDFSQPADGPALVARLQNQRFYPHGVPTDVLWASEGKKLWHLLDSVI
ncbi:glycosyltransferase [Microvirga sp. STS02]|uniref:glycosyltransferase n=1 Tax=Hymenobacter negativus TaxID=2795026 RepID=UPI0018DCC880|nr:MULTISPECIES: glycosyltransferase [Bacteria]MBH8569212.1 glycosyltransferase [Hymenobacter negativus]MBR7208947.1 glycosyltransferase [Microvirga sp. STS02]